MGDASSIGRTHLFVLQHGYWSLPQSELPREVIGGRKTGWQEGLELTEEGDELRVGGDDLLFRRSDDSSYLRDDVRIEVGDGRVRVERNQAAHLLQELGRQETFRQAVVTVTPQQVLDYMGVLREGVQRTGGRHDVHGGDVQIKSAEGGLKVFEEIGVKGDAF